MFQIFRNKKQKVLDKIISLSIQGIKNLHIFNNNTIYIQQYDDNILTTILVIKATCKTVYTVKTSEVVDKRLTLKRIASNTKFKSK